MAEEQNELEVGVGDKRLKIRGSDILTTFGITCVVLVGYMVWEHKADAREGTKAFVEAVAKMADAQERGVQAQRVMNCLIALPPESRESKVPTCERLAR